MRRLAACLAAAALSSAAAAQTIPDTPDALVFKPIAYTPPAARAYRKIGRALCRERV